MKIIKKLFKNVYNSIPLKKNFFSLVRIFFTPSERIYKHLHFKGIIKVQVDESHSFKIKHYGYEIENSIFWMGLTNGWEKVSLSIWIELVRDSNVIIDIGANTGVY